MEETQPKTTRHEWVLTVLPVVEVEDGRVLEDCDSLAKPLVHFHDCKEGTCSCPKQIGFFSRVGFPDLVTIFSGFKGDQRSFSQLFKADLLTFWFSNVGPYLVMAPKG